MKRGFIFLALLSLTLIAGWKGCSPAENSATGKLEFGMNLQEDSRLKGTVPGEEGITAALVTITDASGRVVYDKEPISFYRFGDVFITQSLTLEVGTYMLTEFFLIDSSGRIMWASPLDGSELSHLVEHPLPLTFTILEQQTTTVRPQVVWIGDYTPEQFGYVSFDVDFVGTFCLELFYDSYCGMNPEDSVYITMSGSVMPILASSIEIYGGSDQLLFAYLMPELNSFRLPDTYEKYSILVMNCQRDTVFRETLTREEMLRHRCNMNDPLIISDHPGTGNLIITPEGLHEPDIDQGVFGRITIPLLTDSVNYMQYTDVPVVADLYIFPGYIMDSVYHYFDADGCSIREGFPFEPLQIVRSNSDGFFELRMETGTYLYMVRMPGGGYYIDMYMNSRKGGELIIREAEITKLYISMLTYWMTD
ncbi:MAG: hypothetical protein ACOYXB_06685 [Bacteroidota bacterium]